MYRAERPAALALAPSRASSPAASDSPARTRRVGTRISSTVLALGCVSLLTDISSEMVAAILPLYLTTTVGLTPLAFGLTDGLYQGVTVLVRLVGGWWSDRRCSSKFVCMIGYGLSALAKPAYLVVNGLAGISAVITADRVGKGLRSAPRDALIAASEPPERLGRAFGVHRAMDTVGAMAGPLLAFWMLSIVPRGYRSIFIVSMCIAVVGVAVLWGFVPNARPAPRPREVRRGPAAIERRSVRRSRPLRRVVVVAALLSLVTVSDGFTYLLLQTRTNMDTRLFPLLFLGTAMSYFALSIPTGLLADRFGPRRVYIAGHALLIVLYVVLIRAAGGGTSLVLLALGLLGAYYASTDGVLAALVGSFAPAEQRGTYIGAAQTAVAGGRLVSSVMFGLLWPGRTDQTGLVWFAVGMVVAVGVAIVALPRFEVMEVHS